MDIEVQVRGTEYKQKKKKKFQISIYIVLTNYQPRQIIKIIVFFFFLRRKSLFLNTLKYNYLPTKIKKIQNNIVS